MHKLDTRIASCCIQFKRHLSEVYARLYPLLCVCYNLQKASLVACITDCDFLTDDGAAENGDPIPSEADEELFHSLLAKAGMHLASTEGDESLVHLDAQALQVGAQAFAL